MALTLRRPTTSLDFASAGYDSFDFTSVIVFRLLCLSACCSTCNLCIEAKDNVLLILGCNPSERQCIFIPLASACPWDAIFLCSHQSSSGPPSVAIFHLATMNLDPTGCYCTILSLFPEIEEDEQQLGPDLAVNKTLILHNDNHNKCID